MGGGVTCGGWVGGLELDIAAWIGRHHRLQEGERVLYFLVAQRVLDGIRLHSIRGVPRLLESARRLLCHFKLDHRVVSAVTVKSRRSLARLRQRELLSAGQVARHAQDTRQLLIGRALQPGEQRQSPALRETCATRDCKTRGAAHTTPVGTRGNG